MNAQMKKVVGCTVVALACLGGAAVAGPVGPDLWDVDVVGAHSRVTYTEYFTGGETALVTLDGDGSTDLDIYVYDANGNLIVSETSYYSDDLYVSFLPYWTSEFTIEIRNLGSVSNRYRIDMR